MYTLVDDSERLQACLEALGPEKEIALDTETYHTPGKPDTIYGFADPFTNSIRLVQLKGWNTDPFLIDLKAFEDPRELDPLIAFLNDTTRTWVLANAKFDYKMLKVNLGVTLEHVWDTVIASQLIGHACGTNFGKARGHGLKPTLKDFLGIEVSKDEQVSYWGGKLTPQQREYAANDVRHILELKKVLKETLYAPFPAGYDMGPVCELEMQLIPVLGDMEINGMGFDLEMFKLVQACAKAALPDLITRICKSFDIGIQKGFMGISPAINLDSPAQLLALFAKHGIEIEDTESDTMEEAAKAYPKLKDLMEYRKLSKALSFPYEKWVHPVTGRIHPSYNQLGAGTGRLSCMDPNLQQVPKLPLKIPDKLLDPVKHARWLDKDATKKAGKDVYMVNYRYCFVPADGHMIIGSDYSGQELCVVAAMSEDPVMCRTLSQPEKLPDGSKNPEADLHSIAASEMHGVPVIDILNGAKKPDGTKYRDDGKILNFSLIYGKSKEGFAKDWGISTSEAGQLLKKYFKKFSKLKQWLDRVAEVGEKTRLSRFPEGFPEARLRFLNDNGKSDKGAVSRASTNSPVQGTSATMIKKALVRLRAEFKGTTAYLTGCVHDEILSEERAEVADERCTHIKKSMEEVADYFLKGLVPGRSETKAELVWPK